MNRKIVAMWVSLAMLFGFVVIVDIVTDFTPTVRATTLYVNETGSGGAFTSIQDAINASSDGDTVFVYNGTYYENVLVNKTINLTGQNMNITIINGSGNGNVVEVNGGGGMTINGFTITGSGTNTGDAGLFLNKINNCDIVNNLIKNNRRGINSALSGLNYISNNNVSNNYYGIYMGSSNNNIVKNNLITSNFLWGVYIRNSNLNRVENNNILDNGYGVGSASSYDITINFNNVTSYLNNGIILSSSINNTLTGNSLIGTGIEFGGNQYEHFDSHIIDPSNTANGKSVYYWVNYSNDMVPTEAGQIIVVNCTNITIKNQDINHTSYAISMLYCSNISIINNNLSNNKCGIHAYHSIRNYINNNTYLSNERGIILFIDCNNNLITNNYVLKNNVAIRISSSIRNDFTNNIIILNDNEGISLFGSGYNNITNNIISGNDNGIDVQFFSDWNNITYNNINSNSGYGIYLEGVSNTRIYHNNIMNNTNQAFDDGNNYWDDGYPSGGNYWSDYIGIDLNSTPAQNVPPPDGIGDTNYSIDSDSVDNYPLMSPVGNLKYLYNGWNLISIPFIQSDTDLKPIFSSIDGYYDAVQWYDITDTNDPWKHHKEGKSLGNDLFELNETIGFWIHITNPGGTIFLYNGTQQTLNQTIPIHPGWNMVGYPSLTTYNRTEGLNNLTFDDQVDAIWSYNAATQKWEEMGESDYFIIGRGYYIHAKSECEWEVPL